MPLHTKDLPPDIRKRLDAPKPRITQRGGPYQPGNTWTCHRCRRRFEHYGPGERHVQHCGNRLELDLRMSDG